MRTITKRIAVIAGAASVVAGALALSVTAGPGASEPEPIPDALCLRKAALDLTHRGPTADELARLASGDADLATLVDEYLASPEFEQVVFDWYREQFPPTDITPEGVDTEEPARIAQFIVVNDRDYREVMTADYTITAEGEQLSVTDKPTAGVISTQHYMSAYVGSFRRNWAGHFLNEWAGVRLDPVALPPNADELDLSPDSISNDPACQYCHFNEIHGVDNLAAIVSCYDETGSFDPSCPTPSGSFLTVPATGLPELSELMVASNEWKSQSVGFFFKQLFGRIMAQEEADYYAEAAIAFTDSGFSAKALLRHLTTSSAYCAN